MNAERRARLEAKAQLQEALREMKAALDRLRAAERKYKKVIENGALRLA